MARQGNARFGKDCTAWFGEIRLDVLRRGMVRILRLYERKENIEQLRKGQGSR